MPRSRWILLCLLAVSSAAGAMPTGPVLMGGAVISSPRALDTAGSITTQGVFGPTARVGWELGDLFNSEFSFQFTYAWGEAVQAGVSIPVKYSFATFAGGYTLTFDIPGKKGIADSGVAPYLGTGLRAGAAPLGAEATAGGVTFSEGRSVFFLEFHAVAGVRYTLGSGLAIRGEVAFSTYGGFLAWQPSVGVAYRL